MEHRPGNFLHLPHRAGSASWGGSQGDRDGVLELAVRHLWFRSSVGERRGGIGETGAIDRGGERFSFPWDGPDEVFARAAGVECGARGTSGGAAALARHRGVSTTVPCVDADRVRRAETRARPAAERRKP